MFSRNRTSALTWAFVVAVLSLALVYLLKLRLGKGTQPLALGDRPIPAPRDTGEITIADTADDLKRIEGIGPKIAAVLSAAGIRTYQRLAQTPAGELKQLLRDRGLRLADPATWPEQARLAAAGQWDEFERLLQTLKAGRRA
ncbi:MAG: DUF4332 domain-containing protein [Chloroflexi bacterium]|nr:DUF4332 domain-containing protein [Anaerolineaceae bacterium]NMB86722.1 DUF4332 domain-containing protein [Chloroflexota bacterium]